MSIRKEKDKKVTIEDIEKETVKKKAWRNGLKNLRRTYT